MDSQREGPGFNVIDNFDLQINIDFVILNSPSSFVTVLHTSDRTMYTKFDSNMTCISLQKHRKLSPI